MLFLSIIYGPKVELLSLSGDTQIIELSQQNPVGDFIREAMPELLDIGAICHCVKFVYENRDLTQDDLLSEQDLVVTKVLGDKRHIVLPLLDNITAILYMSEPLTQKDEDEYQNTLSQCRRKPEGICVRHLANYCKSALHKKYIDKIVLIQNTSDYYEYTFVKDKVQQAHLQYYDTYSLINLFLPIYQYDRKGYTKGKAYYDMITQQLINSHCSGNHWKMVKTSTIAPPLLYHKAWMA